MNDESDSEGENGTEPSTRSLRSLLRSRRGRLQEKPRGVVFDKRETVVLQPG